MSVGDIAPLTKKASWAVNWLDDLADSKW